VIEWIRGCEGVATEISPSQRMLWRTGGWESGAVKFPAARRLRRRGERFAAENFAALAA
jgi:hypothetical protein